MSGDASGRTSGAGEVTIAVATAIVTSPAPLVRPLASPLMLPAGWRLPLPLLPVSGRHVVVQDWHHQHGPRNELRGHVNPRAVVSTADVPSAIVEDPILTAVKEEVRGRGRSVADRWGPRNDHQLRGCRKAN